MSKEAEEWFKKNYHTPMDSVLAKYGVPVLHGVDDGGEECWENIPFHLILDAYAKHYAWNLLDMSNEELYNLVEDDNNSTQEDLDEKKGAMKLRNHLIKSIEG